MSRSIALFDALAEHGVERLRFRRQALSLRILAALPEEEWKDASILLPGAEEDLAAAAEMIQKGGHERVDFVYRAAIGLRFLCAVHDTTLGPGAGGFRRHDPVLSERDVLADVLNLSRAMTYKNALGGLSRGGSKLSLHNTELPYHQRERWLDMLAEEIDLSGTITGPDSGFDSEVLSELDVRSKNVSGVRGDGTSGAAALGVVSALGALSAATGRPTAETRYLVQGLGAVGFRVARSLAEGGAALTVTDRDPMRLDALLGALQPEQRRKVNVVAPYQLLEMNADVLVPCAVGGVINDQNLERLKVKGICGSANNQLDAQDLREELRLARRLHDAGILFVPDWIASAGGAIHGIMEFQEGAAFDPKRAEARIRRQCGWALDEVLSESKHTGHPPLEIAVKRFVPGGVPAAR